jgi:WD40 repeat protein
MLSAMENSEKVVKVMCGENCFYTSQENIKLLINKSQVLQDLNADLPPSDDLILSEDLLQPPVHSRHTISSITKSLEKLFLFLNKLQATEDNNDQGKQQHNREDIKKMFSGDWLQIVHLLDALNISLPPAIEHSLNTQIIKRYTSSSYLKALFEKNEKNLSHTTLPRATFEKLKEHLLPLLPCFTYKEDKSLKHTDCVRSAQLSPNGNSIVYASADKTIKIWDMQTGHTTKTLVGHTGWICSAQISSDGNSIVSASDDKTIKIWDMQTGKNIQTLLGHSDQVRFAQISPDGNYIVSASADKTIKIWDIQTGQNIQTLVGHTDWVRFAQISPDGKHIVSASDDKTIKIWNMKTGHNTKTLVGHTGRVNSAQISSDGNYIISASDDKTIKIWNMKTGQNTKTLVGHTDWVNSAQISSDGNSIVSASDDETIKVWDMQTGRNTKTLVGHKGWINSIQISSNGNSIVSASDDRTIKIWENTMIPELNSSEVEKYFRENSLEDMLYLYSLSKNKNKVSLLQNAHFQRLPLALQNYSKNEKI